MRPVVDGATLARRKGGLHMPMLEKWAPAPDFDLVERRMRRFFESAGLTPIATPAADVYEAADEIVVELDVPGYDQRELTVTVSDHTLTVIGDRKTETAKKELTARVRERLESHFERHFQLPATIDGDRVQAEYGKGVLTLHVPKIAGTKPHTGPIETT
jgi:HSP20 family protein